MAVRKIVYAPAPVLKEVCKAVEQVDARVQTLMDDMLETMYAARGIGLAANQIGETDRVIVVDVADSDSEEKPAPLLMANPEVIWTSEELSSYNEGCLSLPEQYADVERPAAVRVRYLDRTGTTQELDADGLLATCIQHEIDHLNGVLFVDYLSKLKRGMVMKRLKKVLSQREDA
ncbi:peptide deformylase [Kiloniella sp. b19]|uniref:peptide deformylase n=1 Tax=Kiloniella sp. GXU_MW_B19 TaxID=3141326 RepID=UPI0031CF16C8